MSSVPVLPFKLSPRLRRLSTALNSIVFYSFGSPSPMFGMTNTMHADDELLDTAIGHLGQRRDECAERLEALEPEITDDDTLESWALVPYGAALAGAFSIQTVSHLKSAPLLNPLGSEPTAIVGAIGVVLVADLAGRALKVAKAGSPLTSPASAIALVASIASLALLVAVAPAGGLWMALAAAAAIAAALAGYRRQTKDPLLPNKLRECRNARQELAEIDRLLADRLDELERRWGHVRHKI